MDRQQRIGDIASSSNSSSAVSSKKYDVFLSFRGEDTRLNFTSHLYNALTAAKIETFIDNGLEKGEEISPALIKAIKDSHISVVIFSENYASSKWCLNELSKIMELKKEKGQIVIPVFYKVDPSHVRHQTGSYKKAFAKHEGQPMCSKWKDALTKAANLSGWHSQNRTEAELLKDIVRDVLKKLAPTYQNQLKRLVGIEKSHEAIKSLLKIGSSEVITLGIWGMGGIGKTTLANALYDNLSYDFEGRCFLANVREKSDKLEDLCNELFSTLLEEKKHQFDSFDMSRLRRKKVFIVLDDVSTPEQLEKLISEYDFLGAGSRVIVTSRDKQILSTVNEIYPVEELNSHHSLQLFCLTAFGEKQPKQGYEDLSRRVISYCRGVPLALKVFGASLRNRNEKAWECELRKLEKFPNMKIHNVFKLSYDDLGFSEKDIFLDIACFFKGEDIDKVTEMLEAFDFFAESGIEVLLDKALITISNANRVEMHDLIQEMGQEIVHQESEKYPGNRSRLWEHKEVIEVLKYNKGTDVVEGLILDLKKLNGDLYLSSDSLAKMTNMRFLKIYEKYRVWQRDFNVYLNNGLELLSNKLRCLHWDRCCLESLPPNFCAEQLVELHMRYSKVKKLWDGIQNLVNLKKIDLSFSEKLMEIPDFSKAEKLEYVRLDYCTSLCQLQPSMLSLPKLTYLYICYCRQIESIKSNVHSKSLRVLIVLGCSSLKEFSVTSEEIRKLDFSDTALCVAPSIGHLLSLKYLDLSRTNVERLPANIKNLSMLKKLQLNGCKKLVSLPELPPSLKKLYLNNCLKLMCLPELPSSLVVLYLNSCWKLVSLPELPSSVNVVRAFNCISLETDITQGLVLQHMLQSRIPNLPDCFIFPGDHVTNECWFQTAESLITISCLPKSDLLGFICCILFSEGQALDDLGDYSWEGDGWEDSIVIYIYQDGIEVGRENIPIECPGILIADHMFFSYVSMSQFGRTSEVHDQFSNITFIFECIFLEKRIKGCGVFPVYATTYLVNSSSQEPLEWESTAQISENKSQARAIGVGDWEQLLPASKRQRTPP